MSVLLVALSLSLIAPSFESRISLRDLIGSDKRGTYAQKRIGACAPWEPFQCPDGGCVPIKYLCDGSLDCPSGYDENPKMCTAATRPPAEETANFLSALLTSHGEDFLAKIFGPRAVNNLAAMGGVEHVAVELSESSTAEDFGSALGLPVPDVDRMKTVLRDIAQGNTNEIGGSEANDLKFYAEKLHDTGFF